MIRVTMKTRKVWHSKTKNRSYLTRAAAIRAEAKAMLRKKYPSVNDRETGEFFHFSELPRFDVLFRRLCKIIKRGAQ